MKITKITPYLFHPGCSKNLLLTRVETDEGIYGWGEGYTVNGKERSIEEYVRAIEPYMIGREPFEIKHAAFALVTDFITRRSSPDFYSAWSSIEIALWDIIGKALGQAVYNLLGGRSRNKVRAYANGWYDVNFGGDDTPAGMAERAQRVKKMGYTAMKWDPFGRTPWRIDISKKAEDLAVECVKQVRAAVGPDVDLLIEVHRRLSPYRAIRFAERIAEFDPFWFEEPCLADNPDLNMRVRDKTSLAIVAGETLNTKEGFKGLLETNSCDVINPDICVCGGILSTLEISSMAEPHAVMVSPHNYNSTTVGLAASIQVAAMIPNFLILEHFLNFKQVCDDIVIGGPVLKDGFFEVSTAPGLGVDIDIDRLAAHPFKPMKHEFPVKGVATIDDEGPRPDDLF